MERALLYVGLLCIAFLLVVYETSKTTKKYNELKKNHDQLKNDMKLLQQENFYLKQMLNINTDSVK